MRTTIARSLRQLWEPVQARLNEARLIKTVLGTNWFSPLSEALSETLSTGIARKLGIRQGSRQSFRRRLSEECCSVTFPFSAFPPSPSATAWQAAFRFFPFRFFPYFGLRSRLACICSAVTTEGTPSLGTGTLAIQSSALSMIFRKLSSAQLR